MEPDSGWGGVEAVPGMQDTASALGASALMVRGSALSPCVLQTERGWRSRQRAEGMEEQCTRPAVDKRPRATSKAWPDATFPTAQVNGSWVHPFTVLRSGGCPEATPAFPDCP